MAQRYADWMYADEAYAIDGQIEALEASFNAINNQYGRYLVEVKAQNDARILATWLHNYRQGSLEAQTYLREYGLELLSSIERKLHGAADDIGRFEGESPAAVNFSGGRLSRLNDAAMNVANIRDELQGVIHAH